MTTEQQIREILKDYSMSVQGLHANVTPFDEANGAPRYRDEATARLTALIAAERPTYTVKLMEPNIDGAVEIGVPGALVGGYFLLEHYNPVYSKIEIVENVTSQAKAGQA